MHNNDSFVSGFYDNDFDSELGISRTTTNRRGGGDDDTRSNISTTAEHMPSDKTSSSSSTTTTDVTNVSNILAEIQNPTIPEIKDEWIDWKSLTSQFFKTTDEKWRYENRFKTLNTDLDKNELCSNDCGDTLRCVEFMLRPIAINIQLNLKTFLWTKLLHKRLSYCGVSHAGSRTYRQKKLNSNDFSTLRLEMYYIGWRFFLIIICQDSPTVSVHTGDIKFDLPILGYQFIAIDPNKITTGKFDS